MKSALRACAALLVAVGAAACASDLPDPSSPAYAEAVAAFYRGIAAAQVGESHLAAVAFGRVTELAPGEPAGWADRALIALLQNEPEAAAAHVDAARRLAPEDGRILLVSALVARDQANPDAALEYLRRAANTDPGNLKALSQLAELLEQEPGTTAEARQVLERILERRPGNLVALLERARLAARAGDRETLRQSLDRIGARADSLAAPLGPELAAVRAAANTGAFDRAATEIAFLQTELEPLPAYRDDQEAIRLAPSRLDALLTRFVRLPAPSARPAPPDTGLTFMPESLALGDAPVAWVRAVWLSDEAPLALLALGRGTLWISTQPGQSVAVSAPGGAAVAALDYDDDFRTDLLLAGPAGLRLLHQEANGTFTDLTSRALPPAVARRAWAGAWAADLDMEGDLDVVLGGVEGAPVVLRNRSDGTFEPYGDFPGASRLRDFAWADLDADGDPDAALLDAAGRLHVYENRRSQIPQFRLFPLADTLGPVSAFAVADLNRDATLDLALLGADGTIRRLSLDDGRWDTATLVRWPDASSAGVGAARLFVGDVDNNGDLDLLASTPGGTRLWLGAGDGWRPPMSIDAQITNLADLSGLGRLDLIGVSPAGRSQLFVNQGTADYFSTSLRPRAAETGGDRRINTFGIGGEIEIRAGLLYQKQPVQGAAVHFGLGTHAQVDVARIIWPNGTVQAEFNLFATNETIQTRQRLKGSCPWVFTYDGTGMRFVTDFLWRTALGLRINAQGGAAVIHSEDWIKIRGDQLVPHDGTYDVRVTAELWETHFFDHVALLVVDHPLGTEAFVDERFTLPAPVPAVRATGPLHAVAGAWDHTGRDVADLVRALDERYVDTFALGPYQGIAEEHYLEVALGDDAPADGPLWLVASGWVYPTDASINVAVSQGDHPGPRGLALEVPNGEGGWTTIEPDLGFPAGKTKTMLIDLTHAFRPGTARRARLRTNMEIYWDRIAWAAGRPDAPVTTQRLLPATADLRYRGFSAVTQARRTAPELPDYARLAATAPQWRDLVGFHTRFGDVRALNEAVDDRYIIMNAGDELVLRFPAQDPPPEGWTRDFVLIGDGWVKDGDYNTGFSTTVLPLPYHGLKDYARAPGPLEDDPAYRRHPEDWQRFHTRYVTPRDFHRALVPADDR